MRRAEVIESGCRSDPPTSRSRDPAAQEAGGRNAMGQMSDTLLQAKQSTPGASMPCAVDQELVRQAACVFGLVLVVGRRGR